MFRTKSNNLSPVPSAPMTVQDRVAGTGTHFSSCDCSWVRVSPTALNILSMGTPYTRPIVERILGVTAGPMGRQMELGDEIFQGKSILGDLKLRRIARDSSK